MRNTNISDFDLGVIAVSEDVVIPAGGTYSFCYALESIRDTYNEATVIGSYFEPEGRWRCGGWENSLYESGYKHTVTVTVPDTQDYCIDAENSKSAL